MKNNDFVMPWENIDENGNVIEEDTKVVEISIGDDAIKELILKQENPLTIQDKLRVLFSFEEKKDDPFPINARELHSFLDVQAHYKDWIKRSINQADLIDGTDFNPLKIERVQMEGSREIKREITEHQLTISAAKEIAMIQRNDLGKLVRRYLIWAEKQLKQIKKEETTYQPVSTLEKFKMVAEIEWEHEQRLKALEASKEEHDQRFEEIDSSTQEIAERTTNLEVSTGLVAPDLPNADRNKRLSGMIYTIGEADHYRMSELKDGLILHIESLFDISISSQLTTWRQQLGMYYGSLKGRGITPPANVPRPSKIKDITWIQLVAAKASWYQAAISWLEEQKN